MLVEILPGKDVEEFEKFGFKRCANGDECYYLCIEKDKVVFFVDDSDFKIEIWEEDDTRIHKELNLDFTAGYTYLEVLYRLLEDGFLKFD
nr:MAG TPA: hypothetical protein [Caudoviricetes sp.]